MVPFIDVMLVLLIIIMVTAPLITPSLIDLPSVGKAYRQPDQTLEGVIGKYGALEPRSGPFQGPAHALPAFALASFAFLRGAHDHYQNPGPQPPP